MSNKPKSYKQAEKNARPHVDVPQHSDAKKNAPTTRQRAILMLAYIIQFAVSAIIARVGLAYVPVSNSFSKFVTAFVLFVGLWLIIYRLIIIPMEKRFHVEQTSAEDSFEAPRL